MNDENEPTKPDFEIWLSDQDLCITSKVVLKLSLEESQAMKAELGELVTKTLSNLLNKNP